MEEQHSPIIECPHCHTRVIPKANNICPACQKDILDLSEVRPDQTAFTIHDTEDLPDHCYACDQYTERVIQLSADAESLISSLFEMPEPEDTTNVILYLSECEACSELNRPQIVDIDYEHQTLTIMVHVNFKERVLQMRSNPSG